MIQSWLSPKVGTNWVVNINSNDPRCTARPSLCRKKIVALSSPVACVTRLPRLVIKRSVSVPRPPRVSIAIDWKMCVADISSYLARFRDSAASATVGPSRLASWVYEDAGLCTQVKSQANALPCVHGTSVSPSGLLRSDKNSPWGSMVDGMLA